MPRKRQPERRRPHGFGSVVKKVSRGDDGLADDLSAHSVRHAFAEAIRRANVDPRTGRDLLRHADPAAMLRTDQHPDRAQMSRAARRIGPALAQPTAGRK